MKTTKNDKARFVNMAHSHKRKGVKRPKMLVEARRARKKSNSRYPMLDLDFDEDDLPVWKRVLYGLATLGCVMIALVGAIFPIIPAIPFWILAIVCMSHCYPPFGAFVRSFPLYRWLIEKLNEPPKQKKPLYLTHKKKNQIMVGVSVGMAVILTAVFVAPLPKKLSLIASTIPSVIWTAAFVIVYFFIREPEARVNPKQAKRRGISFWQQLVQERADHKAQNVTVAKGTTTQKRSDKSKPFLAKRPKS